MKKTSYILALLAAASALLLSSCTKEKIVGIAEGELVEYTLQAEVGVTGAGLDIDTKVALNADGITPNWKEGDQILVLDADKKPVGTDGIFTLSSGAGTTSGTFTGSTYVGQAPAYAIYPASAATVNDTEPASTAVTGGSLLYTAGDKAGTFKAAVMLGKSSDGTTMAFTNACAVLTFNTGDYGKTDGDPAIVKVKVSATYGDTATPIAGAFDINWAATPPTITAASSGTLNKLTVDLPASLQTNDKDVYIPVFPLAMRSSTAPSMKYMFINKIGLIADVAYDFTSGIAVNTLKDLGTASGMEFTLHPLPGVFSVSDDGGVTVRQIQFSTGNLQATYNSSESTYIWGAAVNQYDYIGGAPGNTTKAEQTDGAVVDLFSWSINENPNNNWGINTSHNSGDGYHKGTFRDWGHNFDNRPWWTLSIKEWQYLFNSRADAANKYGFATVGEVKGLIILPDTFPDPMKNGGSGAFVPTATKYDTNVYAAGVNWEAMESAGAVFLPFAGWMWQGRSYLTTASTYWSSSNDGQDYAYVISFQSTVQSSYRFDGHSVRLVTECQ